jgi:hypothetical protein
MRPHLRVDPTQKFTHAPGRVAPGHMFACAALGQAGEVLGYARHPPCGSAAAGVRLCRLGRCARLVQKTSRPTEGI